MEKEFLEEAFDGIFGVHSKEFDNIELNKDLLFEITKLARSEMHPEPFVALLEGYVEGRNLKVNNLNFVMKKGSNKFKIDLPFATGAVGSLHSHPEGNASPEKHELEFFDKTGGIHFIISSPYTTRNLRAFDREGNKLHFFVR